MRVLVTLLIAALPFVLSVPAPPSKNNARSVGFAIPISRCNEVHNENGVVDLRSPNARTQRSISGFLDGLLTYQTNTGTPHPLANSLGQSLSSLKRETGSVRLVDTDSCLWYGNIQVGYPAVTFTMDFDMGSSDLFLPFTGCNSNCEGHTRYNPSASATSVDLRKTFNVDYGLGTGASVSGELYNDTVSIAGLTAERQTLSAALKYSAVLSKNTGSFPPDGVVRLGYPQISHYNSTPLFNTLIAQDCLTHPRFAFKLVKTGSELYLGGTNNELYKGFFTYVPVTKQGFWQTHLAGITINGVPIQLCERSAIIDTGTTFILGGQKMWRKYIERYQGLKTLPPRSVKGSLQVLPCSFNTPISFTFGRKKFPVSPNTFNIGPVSEGSNVCIGGLSYSSDGFWIFGDVFIQNVYTVFDMGKNVIGFADLTSPPPS